MSIGSKETEVFVKIKKPNSTKVERFKVTAGGGGWGAKADIIALSPEAKLVKGSEIQFLWSPQKIGICQIITTTRLLNLQTHSLLPTPTKRLVTMRIQMKASIYMKMFWCWQ